MECYQTCMFSNGKEKLEHKKSLAEIQQGFLYTIVRLNYFLNLAYLFLNLSILPAVSTNLDLPV